MILRVVRGRASAAQLESLRAALSSAADRGDGDLAGPAWFRLGSRPAGADSDVVLVSFWGTAEEAAADELLDVGPLVLAQRHLGDVDAVHFEVGETILRHSDGQPRFVRIATGRFSKPGSDIEMLDLLRQRAPLLSEEMTEAFVGRRVVGRAVEVTFMSGWSAVPADHVLDVPFWDDIALRYDEFEVGVYSTLPIAG